MRRWLCLLVLVVMGCAEQSTSPNTPLPFVVWTDVPMVVKNAARAQRPEINFRSAFRLPNGNYQIRARDIRGHGIAIDITPEGHVVQSRTY